MPSSSAPMTPNNTGAPSPQELNALPISPADSMLPTFLCIGGHYFPIIPSNKEFLTQDEGSDTSTFDSPCSSPSPTNSTIMNLMHNITDMADHIITIDADAFTADFHQVITARDNLIHSLSSPAIPFRPAEVAELRRLTDESATMANRIGFPQIPQNILDSFFNRVDNPEVAPPYSTGAADTPITVQPVNKPSVTAEDIFAETEGSEIQTPTLPPNHFPVERSQPEEDNFNVPPPNIPLIDNILNYYNIPTHANPPLRHTFYRLWTLLTSWTFANNYLYVLNCHMRFDIIPIINTIINLTRRSRAPHEDRWVTLMIWEEICWLHMLRGEMYAEEAMRLTTASHQQCYIEPCRQLALETRMAWTHGCPVVHTASVTD